MDNPVDSIFALQTVKIGCLECRPLSLIGDFLKPMFCKRRLRKHRNRSGILHGIGESAAFGNGAKPVLVINQHIVWIDCE